MNYMGFYEFPFPTELSPSEAKLRDFFLSLTDEEQLQLLNASCSYESFCGCVKNYSITKTG